MEERKLSVREIMKADLTDEILHGVRVSSLAFQLGKRLGLSYEQAQELAVAGFLHDIGKLQVSAHLYGRDEESLDIEEMKYMRSHPRSGYDILMRYDYSDFILETILYHHENYDGSGYPRNLVATHIPCGARMLRLVDTFVALTSDRPYRKAFDKENAVELMIDEVKNFDMRYFLTFLKMIHEIDVDGVLSLTEQDLKINLKEEMNEL